jgi:hypothetical protein
MQRWEDDVVAGHRATGPVKEPRTQRKIRPMQEDELPENLPKWLQKDIVSTRYEVPAADGESHTVCENHYTSRVFRWALEEWLRNVPTDGDAAALRRALPIALADAATFHAYLRVPEAFGEVYREELAKLNVHRAELAQVKRVLKRGPYARRWKPLSRFYTGLLIAYAIVAATLAR